MAVRGRGPAPQPTALKILRGNRGKKPLNKQEAAPAAGAPTMPSVLNAEGRAEWAWLVPMLVSCGLATKVDGWGLALLCNAWADYAEDRAAGKRGNEPFTRLRQMLPEFGLTPASRSRIKVETAQPKSKVDEFRAKYGG